MKNNYSINSVFPLISLKINKLEENGTDFVRTQTNAANELTHSGQNISNKI